jgi:hypothetical protein
MMRAIRFQEPSTTGAEVPGVARVIEAHVLVDAAIGTDDVVAAFASAAAAGHTVALGHGVVDAASGLKRVTERLRRIVG